MTTPLNFLTESDYKELREKWRKDHNMGTPQEAAPNPRLRTPNGCRYAEEFPVSLYENSLTGDFQTASQIAKKVGSGNSIASKKLEALCKDGRAERVFIGRSWLYRRVSDKYHIESNKELPDPDILDHITIQP